MLNAAIKGCPVFGGKVKSFDAAKVASMKGVNKVVQAFVGNQNGDVKAALANAAKKVEAVYSYPFQNHACMEPMNAMALYTPDRCDVWGPTQNGEGAFAAVVAASGLPADKVDVHKTMLGGGFGRRGPYADDYITQAVLIAKQMPGVPVKLCKLVGGFDANNNFTGLHMRLSGQSILASVRPATLDQQKGRDPVVFQGVADPALLSEHALGYSVPNLLID